MTPEEHVAEFKRTKKMPHQLWCHCLDVMKYCLVGDKNKARTFYGGVADDSSDRHLVALSRGLDGKPKELNEFLSASENSLVPVKMWRRFDAEYGDLIIERYLDGDERPFDDHRKVFVPKPALTLIFDMSANSCDRGGKEMAERHEFVYKHAVQANRDGRPCRVVAVTRIEMSEGEERFAFILKDYDDPIFPAIWAPFETNGNTNNFLNVVQDFFIGTRDWGNGRCVGYNVAEDFEGDGEVILVKPHTYVHYN